jgi:hypothetical protein
MLVLDAHGGMLSGGFLNPDQVRASEGYLLRWLFIVAMANTRFSV